MTDDSDLCNPNLEELLSFREAVEHRDCFRDWSRPISWFRHIRSW